MLNIHSFDFETTSISAKVINSFHVVALIVWIIEVTCGNNMKLKICQGEFHNFDGYKTQIYALILKMSIKLS